MTIERIILLININGNPRLLLPELLIEIRQEALDAILLLTLQHALYSFNLLPENDQWKAIRDQVVG